MEKRKGRWSGDLKGIEGGELNLHTILEFRETVTS